MHIPERESHSRSFHLLVVAWMASLCLPNASGAPQSSARWIGAWVAAPQLTEERNLPPSPGLGDTTLRQTIHLTIGGERVRVAFSNAFGHDALHLASAHVALALAPGNDRIQPATDHALTFHGQASVDIPRGALMLSDPLNFPVHTFADLAVSMRVQGVTQIVTGHPGSRTTSFLQAGDVVSAATLPEAAQTDHWYILSGVDVWTDASPGAIVTLGDSITDGRGSTTNGNDRWPDQLAVRLQANPATAGIAVLNQGIGGNRVLRDGLGPNALARLDRDVIAQPGVRWLVVFEGINDLGTAAGARARGEAAATAQDLIAAYEQIVRRAHDHGIKVCGATIPPYRGSFYFSEQGEADRQTINEWMRASGTFDTVVDFDAITQDPKDPTHLAPDYDVGDHLHLNPAGYHAMAEAFDLKWFEK